MTCDTYFVNGGGLLLRRLEEPDRHAINAVGEQVARRHTCMIATDQGNPESIVSGVIGSGTFVRIGSRLFVATAKHLFKGIDDNDAISLYWGEDDRRARTIKKAVSIHESLDLAVIPINVTESLPGVSLGSLDPDCSETENDLFVVSGIPTEKCKVDDSTRTSVVAHHSIGMAPLPKDQWPQDPEVPVFPKVDLLLNYTRDKALDSLGEPMPQIDPHGLSGGGIWSVPMNQDGVWVPDRAKLVAVQSRVAQDTWRYLRSIRIGCWLRLVADEYSSVRDEITRTFPMLGV